MTDRRNKEKQARKKLILDACRSLLLEKGLTAVSIPRIAERAELGVGTIYWYYRSKEEIFATLQEEGLDILHGKICAIRRKPIPAAEQLRETALAYMRFSIEQKDYFDIINYFLTSPKVLFKAEIKEKIDRQGGRILAAIVEIIKAGIDENRMISKQPEKDAVIFWGTLHGLLQFRKLEGTILAGISQMEIFEHSVERFILALRPISATLEKD